jgi:hypothetical protein
MADALAKLRRRNGDAQAPAITRSCEGCDACCTAPGIKELSKPPATPCRYLDGSAGKSCTVYGERQQPRVCRRFYCLWRTFDHILPDWMAPKDCGFVLTVNDAFTFPTVVTVHPMPDRPEAWETPWHQTVFAELAVRWNCIVAVGQSPTHTTHLFAPNGSKFALADLSPEAQKVIVPGDGTVGVPSYTFGPDRRPLAYRIWEMAFSWGIGPPMEPDK